MTVDERFNLPDNIRVLFADEDKGVAGHTPLRIELINLIDGHDEGAPQHYTDAALMPSRLKNVCAELNTLSQRSKVIAADERPLAALGGGGRRTHRADQRGAAVTQPWVMSSRSLDAAPLPSRAGSTDANIIL
jgi:hypothetical protein